MIKAVLSIFETYFDNDFLEKKLWISNLMRVHLSHRHKAVRRLFQNDFSSLP